MRGPKGKGRVWIEKGYTPNKGLDLQETSMAAISHI